MGAQNISLILADGLVHLEADYNAMIGAMNNLQISSDSGEEGEGDEELLEYLEEE